VTTSFRFRVDGQPVSWNQAFRNEMRYVRGGNRIVLTKTTEAQMWQEQVRRACERAVPRGWQAAPQLRIRYWLNLKDSMDADNVLKLVNDGIAFGLGTKITKALNMVPVINDKRFLPCVEHVSVGHDKPWIEVSVEAYEPNHHGDMITT